MRVLPALTGSNFLFGAVQALADAPQHSSMVPGNSDDAGEVIIGLIIIGLGLAIYFLPTSIASKRKIAMGTGTMFCLNLFIGWTVVGWLFLILVAACAKTTAEDKYYQRGAR